MRLLALLLLAAVALQMVAAKGESMIKGVRRPNTDARGA
jgi:hypothetical protein